MNVTDFTKLDSAGCLYRLVIAEGIGWASNRKVEVEADKNVIRERYGDREVVGFEIATKRSMYLFVGSDERG